MRERPDCGIPIPVILILEREHKTRRIHQLYHFAVMKNQIDIDHLYGIVVYQLDTTTIEPRGSGSLLWSLCDDIYGSGGSLCCRHPHRLAPAVGMCGPWTNGLTPSRAAAQYRCRLTGWRG
jgi:hypothetical protein